MWDLFYWSCRTILLMLFYFYWPFKQVSYVAPLFQFDLWRRSRWSLIASVMLQKIRADPDPASPKESVERNLGERPQLMLSRTVWHFGPQGLSSLPMRRWWYGESSTRALGWQLWACTIFSNFLLRNVLHGWVVSVEEKNPANQQGVPVLAQERSLSKIQRTPLVDA